MQEHTIDIRRCSVLELAGLMERAIHSVLAEARRHEPEASASAVQTAVLAYMRGLSRTELAGFLSDPCCTFRWRARSLDAPALA